MQQEISANILLHQHSLTFNNSNIVFDTSRALSITNFICDLNFLQGIHLPLQPGQRIPLLIECYSDSDWAGDINTRQSTSGSLVTILKNNMHSNSKTQQVIATSSAEAELYAISSTIADAIHLKQLITEIENNIGVSTFDFRQASTQHCSFLRFIFCNQLGPTNGDQQKNKAYSTSLFVDSGFASGWATCSSSCFNRKQPS